MNRKMNIRKTAAGVENLKFFMPCNLFVLTILLLSLSLSLSLSLLTLLYIL
ncbi:MAG: hypothetical protein LBR49_08310 [Tannerella sp.]|jgi:hypothetical protein|nr:hypothetical protein [Tannerella sp.]